MKKQKKPRFYIILMIAQPLIFVLFFVFGALLDSKLWERTEVTQGHPAPVFSLLLPILGAVICLAVFMIALVGLIICLRRRRREREERNAYTTAISRFCPCCGASVRGRFCINCGKDLDQS